MMGGSSSETLVKVYHDTLRLEIRFSFLVPPARLILIAFHSPQF